MDGIFYCLWGLYCSRSGFDEGSCLLCSQVFAQLTAQRQAHANAHAGDRGDILGTKAHTAGVAGSVQALDGLIILVQHLLVIGGHKAAGGHQCKAQTRGGDMGVEGSLCNCIQEVRVLGKVAVVALGANLIVLLHSSGKGCRLHTDVLGQLLDGVGAGNSRDIAELLKGHGSFLSACFFYPTAEPPKTQRIFFFEIPNEHCRHIQDSRPSPVQLDKHTVPSTVQIPDY